MTRKITAIITATLLLFALLPVGMAAASANAHATLVAANRIVYPNPGQDQAFTVSVRNNEVGPITTVPGFGAKSINLVRILLPAGQGFTVGTGEATVTNASGAVQEGWTVTTQTFPDLQSFIFRGTLAGQSELQFRFPAQVGRPPACNRNAPFGVQVSSDNGATSSPASTAPGGSLVSAVQALQVTESQVTAPELATNGTVTGDQTVDWSLTVTNHAVQELSVVPEFQGQDKPAQTVSGSGGTASLTFRHTFEDISQNSAARTFQAKAKRADGNCVSLPLDANLTIQRRPTLQLNEHASDVTQQFNPRYVQPFTLPPDPFERPADPGREVPTYVMRGPFVKQRIPTLTVHSHWPGNEFSPDPDKVDPNPQDVSTFSFAQTTDVPLDVPGAGLTWADTSTRQFLNTGPVNTEQHPVVGPEGEHSMAYRFHAVDGNGHVFTEVVTPSRQVTIDGIRPMIENLTIQLPTDGESHQQRAVKKGDTVTLRGAIRDANPDPQGVTLKLTIQGVPGGEITVTGTPGATTGTGNDRRMQFSANVQIPSTAPWDREDGLIRAEAQAKDLAKNEAPVEVAPLVPLDNLLPDISTLRRDVTGQTIDNPLPGSSVWSENTAVLVNIDENLWTRGGCDTRHWHVPEELIVAVVYNTGATCTPRSEPPANVDRNARVLILAQSHPREAQFEAEYNPTLTPNVNSDRMKDPASNYSPAGLQAILSGILPPLPVILDVRRNKDGEGDERSEVAVQDTWPDDERTQADRDTFGDDDGTEYYWTRFGGTDLQVRTRMNVRVGDRLRSYVGGTHPEGHPFEGHCAGTVALQSSPAGENNALLEVDANIGNVDPGGRRITQICVALVSAAGLEGPGEVLDVMLDKITPVLGSVAREGNNVTATFSEKIEQGSNASLMWTAYEYDAGNDEEYVVQVDRVNGTGRTRTLEVSWLGLGDFSAVRYHFMSDVGSNARIYEDRAGNTVAETFRVNAASGAV